MGYVKISLLLILLPLSIPTQAATACREVFIKSKSIVDSRGAITKSAEPIINGEGLTDHVVKPQEVPFVSGRDWNRSSYGPKKAIHPGYSQSAKKIYFAYETFGLKIFIEHGPYSGSSFRENPLERFIVEYNPEYFFPGSHLKTIFGNQPISVDLTTKDGDFSSYYHQLSFTGGRNSGGSLIELMIPIQEGVGTNRTDLINNSVHLLVNRDNGAVFGYAPREGKPVRSFLKDLWLEATRERFIDKNFHHGYWYNSNSGMERPDFVTRKDESR